MNQEINLQTLAQQLIDVVDATVEHCGGSAANNSKTQTKSDGSIVTALDYALDQAISTMLQTNYAQYNLLSEEMPVDQRIKVLADDQQCFWCLDPLDGTSNYASGIPFWCVSLALIDQQQAHIGIIYDYERRECFAAGRGQGAYLNGEKIQLQNNNENLGACIANVDFKRLESRLAVNLIQSQTIYRSQRNFGSCALEWCWLALDRVQVYLHGGMKLWDYAAGELIFHEAGGQSATLDADAVFAPGRAKSSVVAAVNVALFDAWQTHLQKCSA